MPKFDNKRKIIPDSGYTLIELLIVMVIIGLILVFGVTSYSGFNERQKIKNAQQTILGDLRYARSMATNGKKPEGCDEILEGYIFTIPTANSNQYSVYPVCKNKDGTDGTCVGPECDAVRHDVVLPDIQLKILPNPNLSILFFTLGRGTDVSNPHSVRTVNITAPAISADIIYEIGVSSVGSISPQ